MYIRYHVCTIYIFISTYLCFCLYLYLHLNLYLYLSWTVHPSTHLPTPPSGSQQATCNKKIASLPLRPCAVVRFRGERTWPGTSTSTGRASGWSKLSIDQVGSLEIIGFWSMLLPSRPLSRTIYTLEDYITAGLKPENDGGSFWFRWWIFFPDFISFYTYSDFFGVNQPVHFPGSTFEKRKEFVSVVFTHLLGSLQGKSSFGNGLREKDMGEFPETKMSWTIYVTTCWLLAYYKQGEVMNNNDIEVAFVKCCMWDFLMMLCLLLPVLFLWL